MPSYRYRASTMEGKIVEGSMESADDGTVALKLQEMGLLPIPATDARQDAVFIALQDTEQFQKRRGMRCRQMAEWDAMPDHDDPDEEDAFLDEVGRHMKECRTCLAVEQYKNDRIEEILRAG